MKSVVKRCLKSDLNFDEIMCFETDRYYGAYCNHEWVFMLFEKTGVEFNPISIPYSDVNSLDSLDDAVYKAIGEHIVNVSDDSRYEMKFVDLG